MKNIKEVLKVLLVVAIIIPLCSFMLVRADSGWDSDYGGSSSSSSGGSSWSSSSNSSSYSSSSSGGGGELTPGIAIFCSLFISIHLYVFFQMPLAEILDKKNNKIKHGRLLVIGRLVPLISVEIYMPWFFLIDFFLSCILCIFGMSVVEAIERKKANKFKRAKGINEEILQDYLPDETIKSLSDKLFDVFTDVQMAWMNFEYDKLEELCGDELATSYIQELEVLKAKHGQNVMHDFDLKDLQIVRIGKVSGGIRIEVHMMVSFYDYVIDTTNNEVIRGSKKRKLTNHYRLMFVKGNERIVKCPKCGGEFVANSSTNCPYCRTFVNVTGYDYKLIQKGKI